MAHVDMNLVREIVERLRRIPEDAVPRGGDLTKQALIQHFIWTLRHCLGKSTRVPFYGNALSCHVTGPLVLHGVLPFPRECRLPKRLQARGISLFEPGNLDTLQALLEEYLSLVQADELRPARHPRFGELGIDGWDRFHARHFAHHLRQFSV